MNEERAGRESSSKTSCLYSGPGPGVFLSASGWSYSPHCWEGLGTALWPQKSLSGNSYMGLKAGPHTSMALVFFGQLGHFYLRDGCSSPLYFLLAPAVSPLPLRVSTEGWPFPKGCLCPSSNLILSVSCPPLRPGLGTCVRLGRHSESRCDCVYVSRERGVSALA